jgi:CBS-domain-containing membrane protein
MRLFVNRTDRMIRARSTAGKMRSIMSRTGQGARTVADLMQRELVSIQPDASVRDLIRALRDHGIGGMPVVDEGGTVLGTVSSTDVLWLATEEENARGFLAPDTLGSRTVREIMTPDVFGVAPDTSMVELRQFFARTGVHRAVVLEEGRIVGIVSLSDVLDSLLL